MNAPFDPEETHDGSENEDPFADMSATWGAADPDFDRMLRERLGPVEPISAPPYAFERVLLAGRRRRARKVWSISAAAALVVMAGTAGTTVALHGASVSGGGTLPPAGRPSQNSIAATLTTPSPSPSPAASTPSASPSSPAAPTTPPASTTPSVPPCQSDDMQLTVSLQPGTGDQDSLLVVLRNNSGHTCTTFGYPGLQTETVNQQLQTTVVNRQDESAVTTLTLAQGASVSTLAQFTTVSASATASPGAGCGAPAYYLAVIPPDQQTQIVAPITGGPVTVCGNGALNTGPLADGTTG